MLTKSVKHSRLHVVTLTRLNCTTSPCANDVDHAAGVRFCCLIEDARVGLSVPQIEAFDGYNVKSDFKTSITALPDASAIRLHPVIVQFVGI